MRSFGFAAVCASAVAAGTIASSSGSASVTPAPFSTVRRDRWRFVRNMSVRSWRLGSACMRNASLDTIPDTMADNRLSCAAARRTTARTWGMS